MSPRRYTGTSDGVSAGKRAGTEEFVRQVERVTARAVWNNGTWGVRNIRGKGVLSVHSTGRAMDLSYRNMRDGRGKPAGRRYVMRLMEWLIRNGDEIGLEMIIDYRFGKHGRGWRCDRQAWKVYDKKTVSGGGALWADWIHVEISPEVADDTERIRRAFSSLNESTLLA